MISRKVFFHMQRRFIEIFNLPDLTFAGRSILLAGNFLQLPPVRVQII